MSNAVGTGINCGKTPSPQVRKGLGINPARNIPGTKSLLL
jgi:hypothetical protein